MTAPLHVLAVCRHGAGRSQIAAATIARDWPTGTQDVETRVAGTAPLALWRPVPAAVRLIMGEVGLTPVQQGCRGLTPEDLTWADAVVCFAEQETWPDDLARHPALFAFAVVDGSGRSVEFQRGMRDQVLHLVGGLLPSLAEFAGSSS